MCLFGGIQTFDMLLKNVLSKLGIKQSSNPKINGKELLALNFLYNLKDRMTNQDDEKGARDHDRKAKLDIIKKYLTGRRKEELKNDVDRNTIVHNTAIKYDDNDKDDKMDMQTRLSVLTLLIRRGYNIESDIDTFNKNGFLPIHLACETNNDEFLKFIVQYGLCDNVMINEKTVTRKKQTPLGIAIQHESVDCIKFICKEMQFVHEHIIKPFNQNDLFPFTPFEYAIFYDKPRMLKLFIFMLKQELDLTAQHCVSWLKQNAKEIESRIPTMVIESNYACLNLLQGIWTGNYADNMAMMVGIDGEFNCLDVAARDDYGIEIIYSVDHHNGTPVSPGSGSTYNYTPTSTGISDIDMMSPESKDKMKQLQPLTFDLNFEYKKQKSETDYFTKLFCPMCKKALPSLQIDIGVRERCQQKRCLKHGPISGYLCSNCGNIICSICIKVSSLQSILSQNDYSKLLTAMQFYQSDDQKSVSRFLHWYRFDLLYSGCDNNNFALVQFVLMNTRNSSMFKLVNHTWNDGETTMSLIAKHGNIEMMQLLFKHKYTQTVKHEFSVFLRLCKNGHLECLQCLMMQDNYKIDIYQADPIAGNTSLHFAAMNQDIPMMEYLLINIYNTQEIIDQFLNKRNLENKTVAEIVASIVDESQCLSMLQTLINFNNDGAGNKFEYYAKSTIHAACKANNVKFIQHWVQHERKEEISNILNNEKLDDEFNFNPLMTAIRYKSIECIKGVSNSKYQVVSVSDINQYLQLAIEGGDVRILQIVLSTLLLHLNIRDWESFKSQLCSQIFALHAFNESDTNNSCVRFLQRMIEQGIEKSSYNTIALMLDYDVTGVIKSNHENNSTTIPNMTVFLNGNNLNVNMGSAKKNRLNSMSDDDDDDGAATDEWKVFELLGKGGFGYVKRGIHAQSGLEVALKFIEKRRHDKILDSLIAGEIDALKKIKHDNVIKLHGYNLNVSNDNSQVLLVFEYISKGELFHLLAVCEYFEMSIAKTYFEQILSALKACHSVGIIHRDLKPQNLLIDSKFSIQIAHFGLCKIYDRLKRNSDSDNKEDEEDEKRNINNKDGSIASGVLGTKGYIAPEYGMVDKYKV